MSIPKVIHYCWYGNGPKPECFEKCFASWKKYAPDYEIIEWNETNTNMAENAFMQQAYEARKFAFVSDIARLRIVYDHGGFYLDTDVELRRPLDELLEYSAFFFLDGFGKMGTGFGFGARSQDPLIFKILNDYSSQTFSADQMKELLCTNINTDTLLCSVPGFAAENRTQIIDHYAFFSTYDYARYAFHHAAATWRNEEDMYAERFKKKRWPLHRFHRILRSPKIFAFFRKYRLNKLEKIYAFFVYDFISYGVMYYTYKLFKKVQRKLFPRI